MYFLGKHRTLGVWWNFKWPKGITASSKCHGNFNLLTAISIYLRLFQFTYGNFNFIHGNFNLLTAISIYLRLFQFTYGNFNFIYGNFNLLTAISIYSRQFQFTYDHLRQFFTLRAARSIFVHAPGILNFHGDNHKLDSSNYKALVFTHFLAEFADKLFLTHLRCAH